MDWDVKQAAGQEGSGEYREVLADLADELLARLEMESDGTVIDIFRTMSVDPWQFFLYFGVLEKALKEYRHGKPVVLVHAQPEELSGVGRVITPVTTLLAHMMMQRLDDMGQKTLTMGHIVYDGERLAYQGSDVEDAYVLIVCDVMQADSRYLKECIHLAHDMKARHVLALPLILWELGDPDFWVENDIHALVRGDHKPLS